VLNTVIFLSGNNLNLPLICLNHIMKEKHRYKVCDIFICNIKTLDRIVFSVPHRWVLFAVHEVPLISQRNSHATAPLTLFISHT